MTSVLHITVLLSLALLLPAPARAADETVRAGAVASDAATGALPQQAEPLEASERAVLARAAADDRGELDAIRGGIDDHDLTLILGTALVVVIIAILL